MNGLAQKPKSDSTTTQRNKGTLDTDTPPVSSINRFSVLDMDVSFRCSNLVEDTSDLYPPDLFNQETMSRVDMPSTSVHTPSPANRILPK